MTSHFQDGGYDVISRKKPKEIPRLQKLARL